MNSELSIRRNARREDNGFALSSKLYFLHWLNKLFFIVLNSCAMNVIDKNILTVKSSVIWVLCNFAKELQSRAE